MVSKEEYKRYINELIKNDPRKHELKNLSVSRKKSAPLFFVSGVILLMVAFSLIFFLASQQILSSLLLPVFFGGIGVILVGTLLLSFKSNKTENYFLTIYKHQIIDFLLEGHDYTLNQNDYINESIFRESKFDITWFLKSRYDIYEGEDLLKINIPNDDDSKSSNYLSICDLNVIDIKKDKDGNESRYTIYDGTFGYIQFPFNFKCGLCINTSYSKSGLEFNKVELEDIVFNKKFKVTSSDQIEARYILTSKMMENLLHLHESLGKVKITLIDNKMYIGFPNRNIFELASTKGKNIEAAFDNFYTEIEAILNIVNELKTNNKVFKI